MAKFMKRSKLGLLVWCLSFFCGVHSFAHVDYSLGGGFRSYPQGGGVSLSAGYKMLLWGNRSDESEFSYGFLRAFAEGSTAISYHSIAAGLEIYPISFLAIKMGQEKNTNSKNYDQFDCLIVDCTGERTKDFLELRLAAAYQKYFIVLRKRREWFIRGENDSRAFAEPGSSLVLSPSGKDALNSAGFVFGLSNEVEHWTFMVGSMGYQAEGSSAFAGQSTGQDFFGVSRRDGEFTYFGGIGYWRAQSEKGKANFLLHLAWTPEKNWVPF